MNKQLTTAVLLAAGEGRRMGELTKNIPKCLLPVHGRPLLECWLEKCEAASLRDVYINGYYLADQVEKFLESVSGRYSFRIHFIREKQLTGTGGFVYAIRRELLNLDAFFVCHADNFSDIVLSDFSDFHFRHETPLSVALFHTDTPRSCGIVEEMRSDGLILSFREKPENPRSDLASAAMFMISPEVLKSFPDALHIDFSKEVLPLFAGKMYGYILPGFNLDIGTPEHYAEVRSSPEGTGVK